MRSLTSARPRQKWHHPASTGKTSASRKKIKNQKKIQKELVNASTVEVSRLYTRTEYRLLQAKGLFLNAVSVHLTSRKITIISGLTSILVGGGIALGCYSLLPFFWGVIGRGEVIGGVIISSFAGCALGSFSVTGYICTNHLLKMIKESCLTRTVSHARNQFKKNPYFHKLRDEKAREVIKYFYENLYIKGNVKVTADRMELVYYHEQISDYLNELFQRDTDLAYKGRSRQLTQINTMMNSDLRKYRNEQNTDKIPGTSYENMLITLSEHLRAIHNATEYLHAVNKAINDVILSDQGARVLFGCMKKSMPGVYRLGFTNALLHEFVWVEQDKIPSRELFRIVNTNPFVVNVLHTAIRGYLTHKVGKEETESQQTGAGKYEYKPEKIEAVDFFDDQSDTPVKKLKKPAWIEKKKTKGDQKQKSDTVFDISVNNVELDKEVKQKIVGQSDCKVRIQHINKCLEHIEDYVHWNDARLALSEKKNWLARVENANEATPIYHVSAGKFNAGDLNTATLLFTKNGNKVEPIAIAAHTKRCSSEYRIIQLLGGWDIERKTVDLTCPLSATKPTA